LNIIWSAPSLPSSKTLYISLLQNFPLIEYLSGPIWSIETTNSGSYTKWINFNSTLFNYYIRMQYDCYFFNLLCTNEYSDLFSINTVSETAYNYNPRTNSSTSSIKLIGDTVICSDCWTKVRSNATVFEYWVSLGRIHKLFFKFQGETLIHTGLTVTRAFSNSTEILLITDPFSAFDFAVGGIPFKFGLFFQLFGTTSVAVNNKLTLTSEFNVPYFLFVQYGTVFSQATVDGSLSIDFRNSIMPELSVTADASASIGLKPKITAKLLGLVELFAAINPYLKLDIKYNAPSFPTSANFPNSRALVKYGNCTIAHSLEYNVTGLLDAEIGANIINYWTPSKKFSLISIPFVTGCGLPRT